MANLLKLMAIICINLGGIPNIILYVNMWPCEPYRCTHTHGGSDKTYLITISLEGIRSLLHPVMKLQDKDVKREGRMGTTWLKDFPPLTVGFLYPCLAHGCIVLCEYLIQHVNCLYDCKGTHRSRVLLLSITWDESAAACFYWHRMSSLHQYSCQ